MRIVLKKRAVAAFTMVEIAISLGVIAIALVAILGVLPTGVRVQRDNREDTILNQEGVFWVEAIRSGSKGLWMPSRSAIGSEQRISTIRPERCRQAVLGT